MRLSLRAKVLGLFLLAVVSSSAGSGWFFLERSRRSMEEQLERRARTIAWTLAFNCRYAVLTEDHVVLGDLAAGALGSDDVVRVVVADREGRILEDRRREGYKPPDGHDAASRGALAIEMPIRPDIASQSGRVDPDEETLFGVAAEPGSSDRGTARVWISRDAMEAGLRAAVRSSLLLFALSVLSGIAVMLLFLHFLVTPIRRLSERMSHVAEGNLTSRLPEDRTDEIGQVAVSFNRMAEALQSSRAAMHDAQEALLQSSRLAAVGEVAGQAAHEILNPISSVYGRLESQRHNLSVRCEPLLRVLEQIVNGWKAEYEKGGWTALAAALEKRVPGNGEGATVCLLEEDLSNFQKIIEGLRMMKTRFGNDLDFLLREVERVTRIVEGMRSMSRAGSQPEELDLEQVLSESIEVLRDPFERRGIRVELIGDTSQVRVLADRGELIQIFTNLMRNSMQAIDSIHARGEGVISIDVSVKEAQVEVALADNGAGIPPEHQKMLFETTFTSKGPKEGTGLGLGICRRLARGAHGDVRLGQSVPQRGTTMIVELPEAGAA